MPLPQPPSPAPGGAPQGGPPPGPGGPPGGAPQGGDAGGEVIAAIKTLMLFAQAQKQQGNEAPAQALQMFVHSLSGKEGQEGPQEQKMPGEEPDPKQQSQMPMNAAKGASPVM